jgi:hypothetical protein
MAADELRHRRAALALLGLQAPDCGDAQKDGEERAEGRQSSPYAHVPVDQLRERWAAPPDMSASSTTKARFLSWQKAGAARSRAPDSRAHARLAAARLVV